MDSTVLPHTDDTLRWALHSYPAALMTSGFNLNGIVLIELAVKHGYRGEVIFVDTGAHFPETLATRDAVAQRYPQLRVVTLSPQPARTQLPSCGHPACCEQRKLEPLRAYLAQRQPDALLSARSRYQSPTRSRLELVETGGEYVKINPLAHCSRALLERYAKAQALPVNPLYWRGYLSIGCTPTTRPVKPGEPVRAGRWEQEERLECGLWQGERAL